MTEKKLIGVAAFFGLEVTKYITTGNDQCHFATFELMGPQNRVELAWNELKQFARHKDFDHLQRISNPEHPEYGKLYIECESIWCDKRCPTGEGLPK